MKNRSVTTLEEDFEQEPGETPIESENNSLEGNLDNGEGGEDNQLEDSPEVDKEDDEVGKVVLIKRKVLWWPGLQTKTDADTVSATLLNKNKTKVTVDRQKVKPFTEDHSQMEGMSREWRTAYMTAVKIVKR